MHMNYDQINKVDSLADAPVSSYYDSEDESEESAKSEKTEELLKSQRHQSDALEPVNLKN
jgi:hypothetical protein